MTRRRKLRAAPRLPVIAIGAASLVFVPSAAFAQGAFGAATDVPRSAEVRPPAPSDPGKAPTGMGYLLAVVLAGAAIGLAIMPSRRTHQD